MADGNKQFSEKLHDSGYDYTKRTSILMEIKFRYGNSSFFVKAIDALGFVVM